MIHHLTMSSMISLMKSVLKLGMKLGVTNLRMRCGEHRRAWKLYQAIEKASASRKLQFFSKTDATCTISQEGGPSMALSFLPRLRPPPRPIRRGTPDRTPYAHPAHDRRWHRGGRRGRRAAAAAGRCYPRVTLGDGGAPRVQPAPRGEMHGQDRVLFLCEKKAARPCVSGALFMGRA